MFKKIEKNLKKFLILKKVLTEDFTCGFYIYYNVWKQGGIMKLKKEEAQSIKYEDHMNSIKELVSKVSDIIDADKELNSMNFGLFYQHGRLGFVDLDAFAQSTKVRLEENGEEKNLAEIQKEVDKSQE